MWNHFLHNGVQCPEGTLNKFGGEDAVRNIVNIAKQSFVLDVRTTYVFGE